MSKITQSFSPLVLGAVLLMIAGILLASCSDQRQQPQQFAAGGQGGGANTFDTLLVYAATLNAQGVPQLVGPTDKVDVNVKVYHCAFPRFKNGIIGLAKSDPPHCRTIYNAFVPANAKGVSKPQQAVLDTLKATKWSVSIPPTT